VARSLLHIVIRIVISAVVVAALIYAIVYAGEHGWFHNHDEGLGAVGLVDAPYPLRKPAF